jgi:hypothetical protein
MSATTRPLWVGRELVGIPAGSRVVYPADRRVAIVAVPRVDIYVVTEQGEVRVPDEHHAAIVAEYFDGPRVG